MLAALNSRNLEIVTLTCGLSSLVVNQHHERFTFQGWQAASRGDDGRREARGCIASDRFACLARQSARARRYARAGARGDPPARLSTRAQTARACFAKITKVTSDIGEALKDSDVIMVVIPSSAHAAIAKACAEHLRDGHIVILHPGRTCGALEFSKVIRDNGCKSDVTIAEAETFIYASRSDGPAQARIFRIKEAVPLAALPATRTRQVLDAINEAYPQFIDGVDVLHTGLNNMGAIFHPALTLMNAGWIEATHGDYQFYIDGASPSVARMLEVLDRERVTVASALGLRARTSLEWLKLAYDTTGEDLHEAIHNQPGYYGIKAPPTLNHRYLFEDVPMSLVPIASLGSVMECLCAAWKA